MGIRVLGMLVALVLLFGLRQSYAGTQEDLRAEIEQIKVQLAEMDGLKARLAELEKKIAEVPSAQRVSTGFPDAKMKIDGRLFLGVFDTGDQGQFPDWSTDINDAKLRFTFSPSERITIVNRLSTTGAKSADFDYFYLDYAGILDSTTLRIGQRKIDVGQETWTDNPIENILITNSVSHVSGYSTGLALLGRLGTSPRSPLFEVGFVNGPKGVMARPTSGLPVNLKVGAEVADRLFVSASYFDSARLRGTDNSAISVGEIAGPPTGTTEWTRRLWEADLRYNHGSTGVRSVIPTGNLPRLMAGATYGRFEDDATGADDRSGTFWFVEGKYGLNSRLYAAARYSTVNLENGALAPLAKSPAGVNSYRRTSLGLGYRLTDLAVLKAEYTQNNTSGAPEKPSLDQWALGIASKF